MMVEIKRNHISTIQGKSLAQAGVLGGAIILRHQRYYYTFDNSLLFTEHSEHYTNLSVNHNVRFSLFSTGALA